MCLYGRLPSSFVARSTSLHESLSVDGRWKKTIVGVVGGFARTLTS